MALSASSARSGCDPAGIAVEVIAFSSSEAAVLNTSPRLLQNRDPGFVRDPLASVFVRGNLLGLGVLDHIVSYDAIPYTILAGEGVPIALPAALISTDPLDPWVFGGRIDLGGTGALQRTTFRGLAQAGTLTNTFIAFYGSILKRSEWEADREQDATRIGVFRVETNPNGTNPDTPKIVALAISGRPVEPFLACNDAPPSFFTTDAVWNLAWDNLAVSSGFEGARGKFGGISVNEAGQVTFRAMAQFVGESAPRGVIVATDENKVAGCPTDVPVRFVAIEDPDIELGVEARISTGIAGVGFVRPVTLGRPVINRFGDVAFYSRNIREAAPNLIDTGLVLWSLGSFQFPMPAHARATPNNPQGVPILSGCPNTLAGEMQGMETFGQLFLDQPDLNCRGQLVFRATRASGLTNGVWIWTEVAGSTPDDFDLVFEEGDPLPDGSGETIRRRISTSFGRPALNAWGEVAVVASTDTESGAPESEAVLLRDRNGVKRVVAKAGVTTFEDENGQDWMIDTIGMETGSQDYYHDLTLNDRGQVVFSVGYVPIGQTKPYRAALLYADPGQPPRMLARGGGILRRVNPVDGTIDPNQDPLSVANDGLLVGAGTREDGDAIALENGHVLFALVENNDEAVGLYRARMTNLVPADINRNYVVDTSDLGILLGAFGQTCNCASAPYSPACVADLNDDGIVMTADLGILIGAFGQLPDPCEGSGGREAMQMGFGTAGPLPSGWLLAALGWEDVETYTAWLETLKPEELASHVDELIQLITEAEGSDDAAR